MLYWIIPLILIILAIAAAAIVILRKIPELRVLNVDALPQERTRKLKEQLILDRLSRAQQKRLGKVASAATGAGKQASRAGRRLVQRLYAMEQYYKRLQTQASQEAHALDDDAVKRLIDEAEALEREGEYIPAEKKYIEIISHHPKRVEAYEYLAHLYLETKQYAQARETFAFALRLAPDDASVRMGMAELELRENDPKAAVEHLRKAVEKRSTNPKYLDAYIDAAIAAKLPEDAERGLDLMRKANAENTKIPEWERKIADLEPSKSEEASQAE